ncbi:MAG: multicopper oxidase family protein [Chitinophagaceae bacterium]|nr:multicopper oxidase family protein [Chitinophagaceae bacterium]
MKQENKIVEYNLIAGEFNWEIKPGKTITAWGFNNQVPGPVLMAKKGDTLVVRVQNNLTEPTMVHWHGIRLPANMDGTGEVQKPILPGESFEYRFIVPDAGTFWYHSHQNETVQMERGMYGGIVIEDETDPVMDNERVLVLDDMKLTSNNEFKQHGHVGQWIERHDGREGSTNLVNGKEALTLHMHAGQSERWRIVNAASARYFKLSLDGKPFKIIATDGGLLEYARTETELLITPGERFDIVVGPFEEREVFSINSLPYNRVTMLKAKLQKYATVHVMERKESIAALPGKLTEIKSLAPQDAEVNRKVKLSVDPSLKRIIDFRVNNKMHGMDKPVMVGDLQVWEVSNTSLMDHPFHLHGFFFQVLEENGKAPEYKAWKDTYNLKPRTTIKIAWMPDNRPGKWMYHCHIIEHHAAGMMANFEVINPLNPVTEKQESFHGCHT